VREASEAALFGQATKRFNKIDCGFRNLLGFAIRFSKTNPTGKNRAGRT
jgi:hypothetical protein